MKNRIVSFVLTLLLLFACLPVASISATEENVTPAIYVMDDVYGKPGETVDVNIGFKNTAGKNIQQFEAVLSAGEAKIVSTPAIQVANAPESGGAGFVNSNGIFSYACGIGSFSEVTYFTVKVTIPESAKDGDVYNPELYRNNALMVPVVREKFNQLSSLSLTNVIRHFHPEEHYYSFWDFMGGAYPRNLGMLLDYFFVSYDIAKGLTDGGVYKEVRGWNKTSDHAPIWFEFD